MSSKLKVAKRFPAKNRFSDSWFLFILIPFNVFGGEAHALHGSYTFIGKRILESQIGALQHLGGK